MSDISPLLYRKSHSIIHRWGLFATQSIKKGTRILQYTGEKITKKQSEIRAIEQESAFSREGEGRVYIFELNKRYDLDGNTPDNIAKFINHSCDPNCEAVLDRGKIWIEAVKNIQEGDELFFDYNYDMAHFLDHPCHCGSKHCIGYIVRKDQRAKVKRLLLAKKRAVNNI